MFHEQNILKWLKIVLRSSELELPFHEFVSKFILQFNLQLSQFPDNQILHKYSLVFFPFFFPRMPCRVWCFFYCIVYPDLKMVIWQKSILADIIPSCTLLPLMEFNRAWPGPMVLVHQNRNYICYLKRKGQLFCSRFWGWEKIILQRSINYETTL